MGKRESIGIWQGEMYIPPDHKYQVWSLEVCKDIFCFFSFFQSSEGMEDGVDG